MSEIILIVSNKRYSYLSFYIPSSVYGKIILFSTNNIAKKNNRDNSKKKKVYRWCMK